MYVCSLAMYYILCIYIWTFVWNKLLINTLEPHYYIIHMTGESDHNTEVTVLPKTASYSVLLRKIIWDRFSAISLLIFPWINFPVWKVNIMSQAKGAKDRVLLHPSFGMNSQPLWNLVKVLPLSVNISKRISSKLLFHLSRRPLKTDDDPCMSPALEYDYWFCFVALLSSGLRGFKRHRSCKLLLYILGTDVCQSTTVCGYRHQSTVCDTLQKKRNKVLALHLCHFLHSN